MNNFPSVLESTADLNYDQIASLLSLAHKLKSKDEEDRLHFTGKKPIIATSFLENSTRTKHSFAIAIHKLGATYIDFNAETSSLKKGESLEETLLTLNCQGVDLCIIRTGVSHAFKEFKKAPPIKIINGGDGTNEHPTQALLDLFTLQECGLLTEGKTLAIIGDCVHSRVTHSLLKLLPLFGVKILLAGPARFVPVEEEIDPKWVSISQSLDEVMEKADFLYLLRIQKERHSKGFEFSETDYHQNWGLSLDKLKNYKKFKPILHPGPANIGVEISLDLMHSPYYLGYEQVKNSVYMRMAIIQAMIQNGDRTVGQIQGEKRLYK